MRENQGRVPYPMPAEIQPSPTRTLGASGLSVTGFVPVLAFFGDLIGLDLHMSWVR